MEQNENSRRDFLKKSAIGTAAVVLGSMAFSNSSYAKIIGANDKIRIGVIGFSDRFKSILLPSLIELQKEINFEIVALSDIWSVRREEGQAYIKKTTGWDVAVCRNNDELYDRKDIDVVIISTADFQHALHLAEAAVNKKDAYCEKPFAETMEDARIALKACKASNIVVQIGSQRRSGLNYIAANNYIRSGKFGDIVMAEMTWNVNQPGRWRRSALVSSIKESDVDWKRFLMNRPSQDWDPRKYLEYRLFWPLSSGIPGQWMCHQIDTVHWFTGLSHPRSVVANGGIYMWKDGRTNADTLTGVFDYGPMDDLTKGFQVTYMSRFSNSAGDTKEFYYSNGGKLDLNSNKITPEGGLNEKNAKEMGMKKNMLETFDLPQEKAENDASTGSMKVDQLVTAHLRNWFECIRSRQQTNAPVEAGYNHSIATIMTNAAYRTGLKATFDEKNQEVMVGDKIFKY